MPSDRPRERKKERKAEQAGQMTSRTLSMEGAEGGREECLIGCTDSEQAPSHRSQVNM